MKIVICGSVNFPEKIREIEKGLKDRGHEVVVPYSIILPLYIPRMNSGVLL